MTEETIFTAALAKPTPTERAAYLDEACAADSGLRHRVETLLASHAAAGFLETPAIHLAVEDRAARMGDDTRTGPPAPDADERLDFLEPSDQPGSIGRLGHYEVHEVVGRGGMGVVLKAFDAKLHRVVAIKVMAPQLASSATARRRFTREARAAAAVTHDHVVTIHAVEDAGPLPYIVMQFVAGQSLQDRLDRAGPLHLHEVLRIGTQSAAGLAAAHAQGLVHRDVKPANILLENGVERVKLTDFGLAQAADDASLTQAGQVAGTPQYMSPEQAEAKPVDARSDLFSLGSVLYAMCTGRPPFRGSTSRAVLKRVVEDAPPPVREAKPEVPDWLTGAIEKLHAKDPAERYQSAAEVAEVLGRRLAHIQHPSQVSNPAALATMSAPPPRRRKRRWTLAAAVLLLFVAGLGTAEATGVTNVRATVIRILTPEGTLVVETDDPAVKLTVEGDGDLVITGAGPQEVRLRAGSYRLKAAKDGKPVKLDRDLVAISRGDRQIVRVRLEGDAPAAAAPTAERGAFVLLVAGKERKFDTIADAVQNAADGDTIEIRGNGPFVTQPVDLGKQALTIRAAAGCQPVIKGAVRQGVNESSLLRTGGPLVLEGVELHMTGGPDDSATVCSVTAPLHVANCKFLQNGGAALRGDTLACSVRNCEFTGAQSGPAYVEATLSKSGTITLENNLLRGPNNQTAFHAYCNRPDVHDVSIHLNHNTMIGEASLAYGFENVPESAGPGAAPDRQPVRMHVSANLFDPSTPGSSAFSGFGFPDWFRADVKPLSAEELERLLPRLMAWREERNLYGRGMIFLTIGRAKVPGKPEQGTLIDVLPSGRTFADWQRFWKAGESGSMEGVIKYEGGNLLAKIKAAPERVTPADFRLRPDSAGYRAGKDGKDLGADVDLVGPGPAYERWKKTPEYQQWLKETGQVKK